MNTKIVSLVLFTNLALMTGSGCQNEKNMICDENSQNHICKIPYEAIHKDIEDISDRYVRVDGFLLSVNEKTGGQKKFMLFESAEEAKSCELERSVLITANTTAIYEELILISGNYVSVAGKIDKDQSIHTRRLRVLKLPSILKSEMNFQLSCDIKH